MKIKKGYILKTVSDKYVVVPVGEEAIHFNGLITLNKSGKFLFESLKEEGSVESLTLLMVEKYDVDEQVAKEDVLAFIKKLKEKNIIE